MPTIDPALIDRAAGLARRADRVVLGIAGEPGSGKTTLTLALIAALEERGVAVAWLPMDGFHLGDASLDAQGLRGRKGAIETFDGWGYAATLHRVLTDIEHPIYVPGFERTLEQPIAANRCIAPGPALVVTEGNYLLDADEPWPAARRLLAEVWFAETPAPLRHERLVARHVAFGKTPDEAEAWVAAVDEPNAERIRSAREAADLIVPVA
jgi:pantothenate kinase